MPSILRKARSTRLVCATLMLLSGTALAHASSGDAWEEFRASVSETCMKAAASQIRPANILVDPFGSDKYGLAVVTGKAIGAENSVMVLCVYDKQTEQAEVGSPLAFEPIK